MFFGTNLIRHQRRIRFWKEVDVHDGPNKTE